MRTALGALVALGLAVPSLAHATPTADPARVAAQRGLDFLGKNTVDWQARNNCYGCHVQAVTLEGLSVGKSHHYEVPDTTINEVLRGMMQLPGGSRTPEGLSHPGYPKTAKTFGAEAFARYDELVGPQAREDLLRVAHDLLGFQAKDGSVVGDHQVAPVTVGVMQSTFQAAQAWREAFARTADDAWLAPLRAAETYLNRTAVSWENNLATVSLQDVNYAAMGLLAAGASPSEGQVSKLLASLLKRQNADGGWGFTAASDAFATGQTVYALRLAGFSEQDSKVSRGLTWLASHQGPDGSWGNAGSQRAEAMWGVLGLVSVDVLSVSLKGLADGDHVLAQQELTAEARDNRGSTVTLTELRIDDVVVQKVAGAKVSYAWNTAGVKDGLHTIDAVATNAQGQTTRRRLEVYAGNVYLTQIGTRFSDGGTQVTLRDIAPEGRMGKVRLAIFADDAKAAAKPVYESTVASKAGPITFFLGSKGTDGNPVVPGRYRAELSFVDEKGASVEKEQTVFVHDTLEAQQARYAQVEGKLDLGRDGADASNAEVELVDARGNVVQKTTSNATGQYRFKGVSSGAYQVRFEKQGFNAPAPAPVQAAAGGPAAHADATLR